MILDAKLNKTIQVRMKDKEYCFHKFFFHCLFNSSHDNLVKINEAFIPKMKRLLIS